MTFSYDFFRFTNSIEKITQINKKQNISVQPIQTQNLDVISTSQSQSLAKIEPGMEVDATNVTKKSNLLISEQPRIVSALAELLTVQPSFFPKYNRF